MKKWYPEDWRFTFTVLSVGDANRPEACRLGFEAGDTFHSGYECPAGFCPPAMFQIFPILEALRSGGDLRNLGGDGEREIVITCPDGAVRFRIQGERALDQESIW